MKEQMIEDTIKNKDYTSIDPQFTRNLWDKLSDKYDENFILEKEIRSSIIDTIRLRFVLFAAILTPIIIIVLLVVPRFGAQPTLLEEMDNIMSEMDSTLSEIDSYISVYTSEDFSAESDFEILLSSTE